MMEITAISDTHGKHEELKLKSGDILIHAGDIEARTQNDLVKFCDWFDKQDYKYKIFIGGNHDFYLQKEKTRSEEVIENFDLIYLKDSLIEIEGIKIWGTPWSLPFYDWAFMTNQDMLDYIYSKIPKDTDIVVSHAPPHGTMRGITTDGTDAGVKGLPKVPHIICGHIHEGYGTTHDMYHQTFVHNCSVLNVRYQMKNKPIEFNYESEA